MKIVLVDDDRLVSSSLKIILEAENGMEVIGIGHNAKEAYDLYVEKHPDIMLMDIRMQGETGLDAGERILKCDPDAKIIFLTTFSDDEYIIKALRIGAKGYLLKQDYNSILPAVLAVASGQSVFGDDIVSRIPKVFYQKSDVFSGSEFGLTEKETELIQLIAEGLSNKEIAEALYLGEGTVRNYLSTILDKLQLRDRTQLAVFYYKNRGKSQ